MSLDCFLGISMAFEVNESIVSFHHYTSDGATLLKNLLKIFLLSVAGETRNIDLCEFSITFASWRHPTTSTASTSAWRSTSTWWWPGSTSGTLRPANAPSLTRGLRIRSRPSSWLFHAFFTVHFTFLFWVGVSDVTVLIHWLGFLFSDDFRIIAWLLLWSTVWRVRFRTSFHNFIQVTKPKLVFISRGFGVLGFWGVWTLFGS